MNMKKILLILLLLQYPFVTFAKNPVWYQFEVILFTYTNPKYTETESWPDKTGSPEYNNALAIITDNNTNTSKPGQLPTFSDPRMQRKNFKQLDDKQLILKKEAKAIQRSSLRKLISHTGWLQTVHAKNKSSPVIFKIGNQYTTLVPDPDNIIIATTDRSVPTIPDVKQTDSDLSTVITDGNSSNFTPMIPQIVKQLDGAITVSVGRYLHVWTDLLFRRPISSPGLIETDPEYTLLETFRYLDHRRMRSRELHYIDNPSFGILIYALPYKTAVKNK